MDPIYEEFNKKWKIISKIVLGEEVGELSDFKKWLVGTSRTAFEHKSFVSGKSVWLVLPDYPDSAKFASVEEVDLNKKFEPLRLNDVKDFDSIAEAVKERISYTGSMFLGESKFLSESTDIVSSSYVYSSAQVAYSKWIAYSYNLEYCEYLFGCQNIGTGSTHSIRSTAADTQVRCFETHSSSVCQDSYYCNSLHNCRHCMFSFGLRSSSYKIGNLQLTPEEYTKYRKKLLEDMADDLKRKKKLPQLEEFFAPFEPNINKGRKAIGKMPEPEKYDKEAIENAFRTTTRILFGKQVSGLDRCGEWLNQHGRKSKICNSVLSEAKLIVPDYSNCYNYPENRLVTMAESIQIGRNLAIEQDKLSGFSLGNAGKIASEVAFFNAMENFGILKNNIDSEINIDCQNFYKSILNIKSKFGAFNFHGLESEYLFGTYSLRRSKFSIRCYLSADLTRCFEVDSSRNCSDCYFCHNCENVREGMFCFNVKNLNFAIGNVEFPREEYMKIKKIVLDSIANSLEEKGSFGRDIFNLAGGTNAV